MHYLLSFLFLFFGFKPESTNIKTNYSSYYEEAKLYCQKNKLNTSYFILVDLGIHSGKNRFYVYDFEKKKIANSYTVSHGCGDNAWGEDDSKENPKISNEFDSHCSSIGKYIIKNRGVSQWGIKVNYILIGKDITNSNAQKRAIVLHSWNAISNEEIYPDGTPEGWGCPALSNEAMTELDAKLKITKKPTLLWIIKN